MSLLESAVFTAALIVSILFFLRRVYMLLAMVFLGQPENRLDHLWRRLKALMLFGFGQRRVIEQTFGFNHLLLFWGFIILQVIVNFEFIVAGVFPRFSLSFVGDVPYAILGLLADVTSLVVLCVVLLAILRRIFFRPPHIEASFDAFFILTLVGLLMIANFGIHMASIRMGELQTQQLPVSRLLAAAFMPAVPYGIFHLLSRLSWWLHAVVLLVFISYIPYSKHLHILTALPNCFFRRFSFVSAQPRMAFRKGERFGISKITQFTWKDLLDFLACTECGRCADACPATNTGKRLNPKEVILTCKANLLRNGTDILVARSLDTIARADENVPVNLALIGEDEGTGVSHEAIWDCTTCGACVEKCPVSIEQFPKLLSMRRHLVMEKVEFPEELITLFENVEQRSNPWGIAPSDRAKWAHDVDIPLLSERPDAEYLFYIGCVASFNPRMRDVTLAIVDTLKRAGISFAILGKEEPCCGDPLRRSGNEYAFDKIARRNMETFKALGVKKMLTLCPHCYSTFKNDYKEFGADFEVIHHTELLSSLIKGKKVSLSGNLQGERIVFHDSCYLGRYNGIYTEPRSIIDYATGSAPVEMEKKGRESFCCGAGGGRMWMEEVTGTRINDERTRQALKKNPTIIATCCPYCLTMFEDGLKDVKADERIRVLDVAEILRKGIG